MHIIFLSIYDNDVRCIKVLNETCSISSEKYADSHATVKKDIDINSGEYASEIDEQGLIMIPVEHPEDLVYTANYLNENVSANR